ncbi:L-ascorbate peroxidase, cytosolic, partial [Glycine soja]
MYPKNHHFHISLNPLLSPLIKPICIHSPPVAFTSTSLVPPKSAKYETLPNESTTEEQLHTTDADALQLLLQTKIRALEINEAIHILDRLIELEPKESKYSLLKAHLHMHYGEHKLTTNVFEELIHRDSFHVEAYRSLLMLTSGTNKPMEELLKRIKEKAVEKTKKLRGFIAEKRCAPLMLYGTLLEPLTRAQTLVDPSDIAIRLLESLKAEFPILSYADFYPLAGIVAMEVTGGPEVPFHPGREVLCSKTLLLYCFLLLQEIVPLKEVFQTLRCDSNGLTSHNSICRKALFYVVMSGVNIEIFSFEVPDCVSDEVHWMLSYPNFVWGLLFDGMQPLVDRFEKVVAFEGSNLARLGELGGKLLPYFAINRGRSEEGRGSTFLALCIHLKLLRKIVSVKKIQAKAL